MLKIKARRASFCLPIALILSGPTSICFGAAVIGQWSGNPSIWASTGNFSTLYTSLTVAGPDGPGHTVTSGQSITQANLSRDNYFVVNSGNATMTAGEITTLTNWVTAGGILLLFAAGNTTQAANSILANLGAGVSGTAMSVAPTNEVSASGGNIYTGGGLWGTDRSVSGPTNLSFASLSWQQANTIAGGTPLAMNVGSTYNLSTAFRYDKFALGKVYVFGDHFDSNAMLGAGGIANLALFLNLLSQSNTVGRFSGIETPEPSNFYLSALGLAGVILWRRKCRST